jgi:hypothetical protein
MKNALNPTCPYCSRRVSLLSEPWQSQQGESGRHCPFCKGSVEVNLRGSTFAVWFSALVAFGCIAGLLFGPHGFFPFFVAAFMVPVVPSIYLERAA